MKVLITGGNGYIGGRLAKNLLDNNYHVSIASRDISKINLSSKNLDLIELDWLNTQSINKSCRNIDVVIHAAGMNSKESENNVKDAIEFRKKSTSMLIEASQTSNVKKFIYISTAHVYSNNLSGEISEETIPNNFHPYALSHLAAENEVLDANNNNNFFGTIIRLSNCFGAPINKDINCWMLLVNNLCKQLIETRALQLYSDGSEYRDFISLEEFNRIMRFLISTKYDSKLFQIINVGSGHSLTVIEMTELIRTRCQHILGFSPKILIPDKRSNANERNLVYKTELLNKLGIDGKNSSISEIDNLLKFCESTF